MKRVMIVLIVFALLGIVGFSGLVLFVCYKEANVPPATDYDGIIVLGAQVKANGEPSVQLLLRLEKALEVYLGNPLVIVTTGAQGADEPMPEADFMRDWLIERGVQADQILSENESLNTRQNIQKAMAMLGPHNVQTVLIITSDYHLPRALALARDTGVKAVGIGSLCKNDLRNWSRNHLREALAWGKYWAEKYTGVHIAW